MLHIQPRVTNPAVGTFYVIMSAIFFSLGGFMIKLVPWSSLSVSGGRSFFSLLTLLIYMRLINHRFRLNPAVIFGGLWSASMSITFVCATKMTSAANAIILQFTHPVFLIFILWIFYHKKPDRRAVVTCIIALAGIVCFFFDKITAGGMIGNILAIISGLSYAIMFQMKKMKGGDFESSLVICYIISIIVGIPSLTKETVFTSSILVLIILLGAVQTGLATICLSRGLDAVSPVTAALTSGIEPVLNPVLAAIVCGESIGPLSAAGGILVIGSVLAYSLSQIHHPQHAHISDVS
ncbi:MAG: DMT family transporter [Coprococcus sp.]